MSEEHYTVIFVPGARSASRKLMVSVRLLRKAARLGAGMALVFLAVLAHYAWLNREMSQLNALRAHNAELTEQTVRQEHSLAELAGRVAQLQGTIAKLGVMSGVDQTLPPDGAVGGVGGVTAGESGPPSRDPEALLHSLSQSVSNLAERSQRIESFYADQTVLLAHTPSVWPVRGYLSSGYGTRVDPFTGGRDYHPGIDVSAPLGTKVRAPADGVVTAVGRRGAYGNAIIIDHGYGVITRYGHLEGFNVRAGQRVQRGDVIGFIGSTGRSNAPHLHYEVWLDDKAQNPIHYIIEEYRSFS